MSYHYTPASAATATSTNKERGGTRWRGRPTRKEERAGTRWKGEIIVGARDSHAKHPLYSELASQESGTTAMHP